MVSSRMVVSGSGRSGWVPSGSGVRRGVVRRGVVRREVVRHGAGSRGVRAKARVKHDQVRQQDDRRRGIHQAFGLQQPVLDFRDEKVWEVLPESVEVLHGDRHQTQAQRALPWRNKLQVSSSPSARPPSSSAALAPIESSMPAMSPRPPICVAPWCLRSRQPYMPKPPCKAMRTRKDCHCIRKANQLQADQQSGRFHSRRPAQQQARR